MTTELPDWIPADAWAGYVAMRKQQKKVMTPRAQDLQIKNLAKLLEAGHDLTEVLDQSTTNNWTDLYEPKERRSAPDAGRRGALPQLGKHGQATAANAREWIDAGPMDDTLEQRRQFASLLTGLSDYYKSEISRAVLGIYWEGLRQYQYAAIEKACWAHTQSPDEAGRWMPRNADIIKMIDGGTDDRSQIAWTKVDTAVRVRGTWDDVVFDDAVIHRVIADMGGWVVIGSKDDREWPFTAKEFQQRYRSYAHRGQTPEYTAPLVGIANAHNGAKSLNNLPPILLGDIERAKQVLRGSVGAQALGMKQAGQFNQLKDSR